MFWRNSVGLGVRKPGPEMTGSHVHHAAHVSRLRSGHEAMEQKGTNPGPPDRTRRTRRTAFVLRTPPSVLNNTAANCGPPFGTNRPQVQILSPRPCFRRPEARTRNSEGRSCCPYRSKMPQVTQQIRTFVPLIKLAPQAGAALRLDEEAAGSNPVTPTVFPQVRGPCQSW